MSNIKQTRKRVIKKEQQPEELQIKAMQAEPTVEEKKEPDFTPTRCNYCGDYIFSSNDLVQYKATMLHKACFEKGYRNGNYEPETEACENCGHEVAVTFLHSLQKTKNICPQCLTTCATCGRKASADSLVFIDGKLYHPSCLVKCSQCGKLVPLENIAVIEGKPVCKECK